MLSFISTPDAILYLLFQISVSYTHLDVYKRQVLKNAGIKNTAAATTNEIAAYLLNEADSAVNGGENSYNYDMYGLSLIHI